MKRAYSITQPCHNLSKYALNGNNYTALNYVVVCVSWLPSPATAPYNGRWQFYNLAHILNSLVAPWCMVIIIGPERNGNRTNMWGKVWIPVPGPRPKRWSCNYFPGRDCCNKGPAMYDSIRNSQFFPHFWNAHDWNDIRSTKLNIKLSNSNGCNL